MAKVYKIHPGIGIGRIGNSPNGFFIGPERPGAPPQELSGGQETDLVKYKDANGRIKRQAARFRVFEYESDATGVLAVVRELTSADAEITWKVELANSKAAAPRLEGRPDQNGVPVATTSRNPGVAPNELTISPVFQPISGVDQHVTANPAGKFLGQEVFLGELRTDSEGRLIVLGGRGSSGSVPAGIPINDFADNPRWHDDVSDGTVTAEIRFADNSTRMVEAPSWVIFGPPDFAPAVKGITTLYDVAFQAAVTRGWTAPSPKPSYRDDILPILRRASNLRWVNNFAFWDGISRDEQALGSTASNALRKEVFQLLMSIRPNTILDDFRFTKVQTRYLEQWRDGDFTEDLAAPEPPATGITPDGLDRASLENTVGGGFFPGIEAGIKMTYAEIYQEPFRLTANEYQHFSFKERLRPGSMSERMALPWQADFSACAGNWWPAQRPDEVIVDRAEAVPVERWDRGAEGFEEMVSRFSRLGFIVEGTDVAGNRICMETERDPNL